MVLTKKISKPLNGPNTKKEVEDLPRRSKGRVDHWGFLDEIEAPTWADLTLECGSVYEDKDDEWFHTSHPFHELSAEQLISTFSQSSDILIKPGFDVQGLTSPTLPPSVSKSRGKDYRSQKPEPIVCSFALNKNHQVKGMSAKSSIKHLESGKDVKNKAFCGKVKSSSNFSSESVAESTLTETNTLSYSRSVSSLSDRNSFSKSQVSRVGDGDLVSTITSATNELPTIGLPQTLSINLRKSRVTRQASRVVFKDMRESEVPKSSSSKSSVGSSVQPGSGETNLKIPGYKDKTPESRNLVRVSQVPNKKMNRAYVDKVAVAKAKSTSLNPKFGTSGAAKKEPDHDKQKRLQITRKVNECVPLPTRKKPVQSSGVSQSKTLCGGKENQAGLVLCEPSRTGMTGAFQNIRVLNREIYQKIDKAKVVVPVEKRAEMKKFRGMSETVYFR